MGAFLSRGSCAAKFFTEWVAPNCSVFAGPESLDAFITNAQNSVRAGVYKAFSVRARALPRFARVVLIYLFIFCFALMRLI